MAEYVLFERVVVSRDVLHGKPRIAGTRIPVTVILDLLAGGVSIAEILSDDYYPDLNPADVLACIGYASQVIQQEVVVPVE